MAKKRPEMKVWSSANDTVWVQYGSHIIHMPPSKARDLIDMLERTLEPVEVRAAFSEIAAN